MNTVQLRKQTNPTDNKETKPGDGAVTETDPPSSEEDLNENRNIRKLILISGILISLIGIIVYLTTRRPACDMSQAKNRDFNKYYGLINITNHFITPIADECNAVIIYSPALPQSILKPDHSASSFLTLAKYGTGKSLLRCEYYKHLDSDDYFKVLILNKEISEYFQNYVTEKKRSLLDCEKHTCLMTWSDQDFAELLLSTLATNYIETYYAKFTNFPQISFDEKIALITIACYYYHGLGTSQLEYFINSFLRKEPNAMYQASKAQTQVLEQNEYRYKPLYAHLMHDLEKFLILNKNFERLKLLLVVLEGEDVQIRAQHEHLHGKVFQDLIRFTTFIKKHVKKSAVFIIDGIDENREFFQNNQVNQIAFDKFCRSSITQNILTNVMATHFHLSLFYPKIDGIHIENENVFPDKFPVHKIDWKTKSLLNYADYVLQEMNQNASNTRCTSFTNFKTLVNYSNRNISSIIDQIPTPRALHHFMDALIREMNHDAGYVQTPFIATEENVHNAFRDSSPHFERRTGIK
jgi:hypothetical protein